MRSLRMGFAWVGLGAVVAASACAPDLDTTRSPPPRGTVGEEIYGVFCDRVGAQALREDLTGASFNGLCHKAADGTWATDVDQSKLPGPDPSALDTNNNPVSIDQQMQNRAHAVARVMALAHRRADLVAALDATFPEVQIPVKDTGNADPAQSCNAPAGVGTDTLTRQLADLLGRMGGLYDDGTIPASTESLGRVLAKFRDSDDARSSYARFDARQGYRPAEVALGASRPIIAYPAMRDLANVVMAALASDSNPQPYGSRNPLLNTTPGTAFPALNSLLQVTREELRTVAPDAVPVAVLGPSTIDGSGREVLTRPRTNLEFMQKLFYAEDAAFGGGDPAYITKRDPRGYAEVALVNGLVPPPFVDANGDGFADVDSLGRFVTSTGQPPPTPFFAAGQPDAPVRDAFGRALTAQAGPLYYDYVDTNHTFAASLMNDLKSLVVADPAQQHETLMNALGGAYVLYGPRDGSPASVKQYDPDPDAVARWNLTHVAPAPAGLAMAPVTVQYDAFHTDLSPMLDLVYAIGQMLGDPTIDDTLQLTQALMTDHPGDFARLVGDALQLKAIADKHPEAHIPGSSTFWDEFLDVAVAVDKEPGLKEDVLRSLGADEALPMGQIFSNYFKYSDRISYDRNNLNGAPFDVTTNSLQPMSVPVDRTKPDAGFNRSAFQRFVQAVHDTNGLTVCNKAGAVMHAQGVPILGSVDLPSGLLMPGHPSTFAECEVLKIEGAAKFYLDSVVGKAHLFVRSDTARNGICIFGACFAAATVDLLQQSSGITGFWDAPSSQTLRPEPTFLNRLMFFDLKNDSPNPGDPDYTTNHFLADMSGDQVGSSVCPERIIPDPCTSGNSLGCSGDSTFASVDSDGNVHGLRSCQASELLYPRDVDTIFTWEDFGFYKAVSPLLTAFANHGREDLFIELMEVMHRHWADAAGDPEECKLSSDPNAKYKTCSKDGVVTYEPLLSEMFSTDILPALHDLTKTLEGITIQHCDGTNPCVPMDGISALAQSLRALLNPDLALQAHLTDRSGSAAGQRNDGTTNAQVTPIYLITGALNGMDAAFATYATQHPSDGGRQLLWRSARSQLVDQFLSVNGTGTMSQFANRAFPKITPVLIDALRAQILANCPQIAAGCTWARRDLAKKMAASMAGPLFATQMGLVEALRANDGTRGEVEKLLSYLLDSASQNDALRALLASSDDMIQSLRDDTNLIAIYHVMAEGAAPSLVDEQGNVVERGMMDAQLALLTKLAAKAFDQNTHAEVCANELDPNQVMNVALGHLVTPMPDASGKPGETPMEVILDVIADVNRQAPDQTGKLGSQDYASIQDNVVDFLTNKERGLEQFYAIVRQGTE